MTGPLVFNRDFCAFLSRSERRCIDMPGPGEIRATLGLLNASPEDALRYGGPITRAALSAMQLRHDRRHVVVDVKVHMLLPGMCPAIPGWHTDGVPRGPNRHPRGPGNPDIFAQREMRAPRFHILVTPGATPEFIDRPVTLVPDARWSTTKLYAAITEQVEAGTGVHSDYRVRLEPHRVYEFSWWDLHRGVAATDHVWRYLIRVTETDYQEPDTDLRNVLRTQQQVYVPMEYGW